MQQKHTVKISKILFKDYLSFMLLLACIASTIFIVSIPLLLLFVPLLIMRVSRIKKTIEQGETVTGIIASKRFSQGEWIVWYAFKVNDTIYKVRNVVVAFKLPFNIQDSVEITYKDDDPDTAFLPILYAAS